MIISHIGADVVLDDVPEGAYKGVYVSEDTDKPDILINKKKSDDNKNIYAVYNNKHIPFAHCFYRKGADHH